MKWGQIGRNVRAELEAINKNVLTLLIQPCETKQPVIMLVLLFSDSFLSLVQNLDNRKKLLFLLDSLGCFPFLK